MPITTLATTIASVATAVATVVGVACWSLVGSRGSLAVGARVCLVLAIVVLGPLVVVGPHFPAVLLVVVGLGVDGVIGLAPAGVVVTTVSLLGPLVVVVATLGSTLRGGSSLFTVLVVVALVLTMTIAMAVARAMAIAISAVGVVVGLRGSRAIGGGTVDVAVLAPGLGTPLVVVVVVPLIVGLGVVALGPGLIVGLFDR